MEVFLTQIILGHRYVCTYVYIHVKRDREGATNASVRWFIKCVSRAYSSGGAAKGNGDSAMKTIIKGPTFRNLLSNGGRWEINTCLHLNQFRIRRQDTRNTKRGRDREGGEEGLPEELALRTAQRGGQLCKVPGGEYPRPVVLNLGPTLESPGSPIKYWCLLSPTPGFWVNSWALGFFSPS